LRVDNHYDVLIKFLPTEYVNPRQCVAAQHTERCERGVRLSVRPSVCH